MAKTFAEEKWKNWRIRFKAINDELNEIKEYMGKLKK